MGKDIEKADSPEPDVSTAGYSLGGVKLPVGIVANSELEAGTQIGDFLILNKIGPGGCGVVYKALQISVSREVALKVIKPGISAQAVIERFNQEKKTLGSLNHPKIVSVIAGGDHNGQPYIAMEYVDGLPITKYADKNNLTITDRLRMFQQVCEAVEFAHEKKVIHRDLKPANILVTESPNGEPMVKVIDFGIAKVVNYGLPLAYATQTGQPIGSPAYMSPEQTGNVFEDINESADIYSLGVLLYELLVGNIPLEIIGSQEEQIRTICATKPLPPSARINEKDDTSYFQIARKRRVDPAKLKKQLKGELDRIVMKCLEKKPNLRYESVEQIAADIQNCIEAIRNKKFNKFIWATALILVLAIGTFTAVHFSKQTSSTPSTPSPSPDHLTVSDISTPTRIIVNTLKTLNNR